MSHWALGQHLIPELGIGNLATSALVELVYKVSNFFVTDVEASALDHSSQLVNAHSAVVVEVKTVEGLVHVEAGEALKPLANHFSRRLNLEMNAPKVALLELSVLEEAVVTAVEGRTVVGRATSEHVGIVGVLGLECPSEFGEVETSVSTCVVSSHEELDLLRGGEHSNCRETFSDVVDSDDANASSVEDCEGIVDVEVLL